VRDNTDRIDSVMECLTDECCDCTGYYVNRLFNHRLQCTHGCHKLKAMMLEGVDQPESNTTLRASSSVKGEENEH
jgi:hypothetical protein